MSGNVWEWCWDDIDGELRRHRGGGWSYFAYNAEVSNRGFSNPVHRDYDFSGFRVVLSSVP
jgi:formylglycine-generating enzyme required for sulfatase activity